MSVFPHQGPRHCWFPERCSRHARALAFCALCTAKEWGICWDFTRNMGKCRDLYKPAHIFPFTHPSFQPLCWGWYDLVRDSLRISIPSGNIDINFQETCHLEKLSRSSNSFIQPHEIPHEIPHQFHTFFHPISSAPRYDFMDLMMSFSKRSKRSFSTSLGSTWPRNAAKTMGNGGFTWFDHQQIGV